MKGDTTLYASGAQFAQSLCVSPSRKPARRWEPCARVRFASPADSANRMTQFSLKTAIIRVVTVWPLGYRYKFQRVVSRTWAQRALQPRQQPHKEWPLIHLLRSSRLQTHERGVRSLPRIGDQISHGDPCSTAHPFVGPSLGVSKSAVRRNQFLAFRYSHHPLTHCQARVARSAGYRPDVRLSAGSPASPVAPSHL